MQCLPSWDVDHHDQLPLFGFTARRLLTALLAGPGEQQLELFGNAVSDDPVLALWVALRAQSAGYGSIDSLAAAAQWLAVQWSAQLTWPIEQQRTISCSGPAGGELRWQQRARESVLAARLCHDLMQDADGIAESTAAAACWNLLLEQSVVWAEDCCDQPDSPMLVMVRELVGPGLSAHEEYEQYLEQARQLAVRLLSSGSGALEVTAENGFNVLSAETLQEHLDYVRGAVDLAVFSNQDVQVLHRLARLERLESRFDEVLEQEKLAALKELAYGASHEINNPLANISSRAQTLLREESDPERQRMLATINSQAFRAHEMISDMMLFAKPPQMNRKLVDLRLLVSQVIQELTGDADRQGTKLRCLDPETPLPIAVDEIQLSEALRALCRNALESIGMGGEVDVSAEPILPLRLLEAEEDAEQHSDLLSSQAGILGATISVKDNGPGIPDQVRAHLFDPFFSGREAGRGLGFGLSKCWRIVTEHGGQVEVHSSEKSGTIFTLRLPAITNKPGEGEAESSQAEAG